MLATSANPTQRLATARTIITRTKMSAKAAVAAKSTLSSLAHKAQSLANNAQSKPMPPQPDAPDREPVTSPNVLLPVVEAFEECCGQHESVRQAIADAIGMLTFVMTPGSNLVATLNLHQSIEQPVVAPSPAGVPPIKDGVLVYNGCFEAGHQGCFSKAVVMGTLEAHFRCREKGFVHALMEKTVPDANARISSVMGKPVQIEVIWTSIFREGLTTEQRIDVADTLAGKNSQFVIQPIVQAIATVVQKIDEAIPAMEQSAGAGPPDNPVKARVSRIVITGLPGAQAKPGLALTPLAQGTDMSSALTYSCALERGTIGCFDVTDFKATLRKIFGIETPKEEKGLQAVFSKADATVAKVGDQISKKLNKMKFW